jgi:hypothetical protein
MSKTNESLVAFFATLKILVVGDNHCWGKADTLEEALSLAWRPKRWVAYLVHPETSVHEVDGSLMCPKGYAPRKIFSRGVKATAKKTVR